MITKLGKFNCFWLVSFSCVCATMKQLVMLVWESNRTENSQSIRFDLQIAQLYA